MSAVPRQEDIRAKNPLRVGVATLGEIERRLRAFQIMNQSSTKKRYILSRESLREAPDQKVILEKSAEIDLAAVKLLSRYFKPDKLINIFQPDEGVIIVSDMSSPQGISFTMDIVTQTMKIGGGIYEGFIERVDSFGEMLNLLKKVLFPRVIVIGYLLPERIESEKINFVRSQRIDQYIHLLELTHSLHKKEPYFFGTPLGEKCQHAHVDPDDPYAWSRLTEEVVREYTRDYVIEEKK